MKHKGCTCEFAKKRNEELLESYRKIVNSPNYVSVNDMLDKVVNMPSSRFWVSEERAAVIVGLMRAGKRLPKMWKTKKEMFREIYRRYVKFAEKNPELTLLEAVSAVVHQPAPKFYLTPKSARVIIYYAKRKCFEQKKKQLKHLFY